MQTELKKKENEHAMVAPYSASFSRTMISTIIESDSEGVGMVGQTIRVAGWVKTGRVAGAGAFAFLEVNDGSCFANMQVMIEKEVGDLAGGLKEITPTATCVLVEGVLAQTPEGTKQKVCALTTCPDHILIEIREWRPVAVVSLIRSWWWDCSALTGSSSRFSYSKNTF